jgi:hypothetical protein
MSDKDYKVWFAGSEIPVFQAWEKLDVANQALEVLERFNEKRAQLATELTLRTAEEVRRRLSEIEILLPEKGQTDDSLEQKVRALLLHNSPEGVIDVLRRDHNVECDLNGLIQLGGTEAYLASLTNEAGMFLQNAISVDQIAELWNEAKRPAPGKPFWDSAAVKILLKSRDVSGGS